MIIGHTLIGELVSAELDMHSGLPTITLHLRQRQVGYTHQPIVALRSYPGTVAAGRQAQFDHADLQCGRLYRVTADAVSSTAGAVYLLGVQDVQRIDLPRPGYFDARVRGAPPPDDDLHSATGLALSMPAMMKASGGAA